MKTSIKSICKKAAILSLLLVGFSSFAQENPEKQAKKDKGNKTPNEMKTPEEKNEARLNKLTKDLSLDANQQIQMKQLITEQTAQREAMKAERKAAKESNVEPTKEDREAMKAKRNESKLAMDTKVKAILNPAQFDKYKAMEEANKSKYQQKNNNGGEEGRGKEREDRGNQPQE